MEPIKFISPSSFFYWEKCPLKAVYSQQFRNQQIFPKHPDTDLGSIIHSFFENKTKWKIFSPVDFEKQWEIEINKLDDSYKKSEIQNIYFPIKWNANYFAVKKFLLKTTLLNEVLLPKSNYIMNRKFEQWIDDGKDIGGKIDYMILNEKNEIVEIVDFKTGNVFEFIGKKKFIKQAYINQLVLYAYIVKANQLFYPKCFIQDIMGNKYEIDIKDEVVNEFYNKAKELKERINKFINEEAVDQLANPTFENCSYCDFRPVCDQYKKTYINNLEKKNVDIYGQVMEIYRGKKIKFKIQIQDKIISINNISTSESIKTGDSIFIYNLYRPEVDSKDLFARKETLIKPKENN